MSSDGAKPRFYVINRGSGSEGSDEEYVYKPNNVQPRGNRHLPHPPKPLPTPAISTNIRGPRYQPSSQSLSSPSPTTTSSPGANDESTPPPTTPALEIEPLPDVYTPTRSDVRPPRLMHPLPQSSSPKRPEISPTDTGRTLILVTADSERYVNVDITGAKTPTAIRECVFTKLNILNESDQSRFSIYQTEIGTFAISTALSDERLFELCRKYGDAKGSLKLLVIDSSLPVRTLPSTSESPQVQVTVGPTPLRPRRRSRSRRGSLSSGTSEQIPEVSAGYEADLDNPVPVVKPHHHHQSSGISPSSPWSNGVASSALQASRPNTPPPTTSPTGLYDRYGNLLPVPPPPPPLSPDRSGFVDTSMTPPADRQVHVRAGSDPSQEPILPLESDNGQVLQSPSRPRQDGRDRRPRVKRNDTEERSETWVLVPRDGTRDQDAAAPPDTPRKSPASARSARHQVSPRYKQATSYNGRLPLPPPPRNPPPAVPASSNVDARPVQSRPPGQPVPYAWTVTWKGEEKGASGSQPSSSSWSRLAKGTRSMDNLRAPSKPRRPPPPLPMSHSSGNMPYGRDLPSSGPKSYESRTHSRPLPLQGSHNHSTLDLGPTPYHSRYQGYNTPTSEPYPRPSSALEDTATSPNQRYQRQAQSPTYGSTLDLPDLSRSARASSPNQQIFAVPSRSTYDRDGHHLTNGFHSPPRSPVSPRSPRPPVRDRLHDSSMAEPTLTREDHGWLLKVLDPSTELPKRYANGDPSSSYNSHPPLDFDDSDSSKDESGTSLWARPPGETAKGLLRGPPLTVQIESPSGVHPVSIPSAGSSELANSTPRPTHSPSSSASRTVPPLNVKSRPRGSTFTERESSWAPRPPPEDVYERLEEFFPEHDLDKPLIEATSGGTSPTTVEQPVIPPPPIPTDKSRIKGKKSIRLVAEEHKRRIDRTSKTDSSSFNSTVLRKRSTKLWGSKLEEVTTLQTKSSIAASLPDSPSTGSATFKWVRGELIGRGTYGRVYLAMNATTGEMMAVKQVEIPRTASDKNDSRHTTVVQALKLESETLKDLDHSNIVSYLGFEETPENLSIFLEYVPGGSIGSCLLRHGKFEEDVTKSFTAQILDGLEYLHSKGILHRDLKADNILVLTDGTCKISDFGISKRTEDSGAATAMQGTVFWMAPEVVNPQGKAYNFKIDIWSVGCVVLEMWAGMRPWQGDELVAVMFKLYQLKQPPPVPDGIHLSDLANDLRERCFAINPDERPTATELRKHKYLELTPGWVFNGFK